jgi:uncharacterized protein YcgL (UPF0745 family)
MSRLVKVFKGDRKPGAYLYVDFADALERVPEALLVQFGETVEVLSLKLTADRNLPRADAQDVLTQIEVAGFYLQLPPPEGEVTLPPQPDHSQS